MLLLPSADSSLGPQFSLDSLPGRHFFHHFRTITIPDFVRLVCPNDFWTAHVLPLCHTEPAVLYAATALGAAHNLYLACSRVSKGHPKEQSGLACATIQHYNHSIQKILSRRDVLDPANGDYPNLGSLLVCCILFVCLENLLGRPQEALRHMRAGAALLMTINLTTPCRRVSGPIQSQRNADLTALDPILRASATVLSRFGVDASLLQHQRVIPDIRPYATMPPSLGDSSKPFSSLHDAKEAIWDLDARMAWLEPSYPEHYCHSELVTHASTPDVGLAPCSHAWAHIQADFRRWSSKLNHTMAASIHTPAQTPSPELRERLMMSLRHRMWDMFMADESTLPMICDVTLSTVEHVYEVEQALSPRPVFTLDCDTIPLLVMMAAENEALSPRILALLRGYQRREGMWDSAGAADRIERMAKGGPGEMSFQSWNN